jgi:hypothetical protein
VPGVLLVGGGDTGVDDLGGGVDELGGAGVVEPLPTTIRPPSDSGRSTFRLMLPICNPSEVPACEEVATAGDGVGVGVGAAAAVAAAPVSASRVASANAALIRAAIRPTRPVACIVPLPARRCGANPPVAACHVAP